MGTVLYAPVRADGAAEDLGTVTGLAGVVADLLARGPQAGAGVLDGSAIELRPSCADGFWPSSRPST